MAAAMVGQRACCRRCSSAPAIEVIAFTQRHALVAADAYAAYGRGRHAASLDFGDCLAYAAARLAQAPLPFVGDDFSRTDQEPALEPP